MSTKIKLKRFEIPYNFDNDYFQYLKQYRDYFKYIKFIYLPAYKENGIKNTRETISLMQKEQYIDYNKYTNVIKSIQSLDLDVCILIQKNATLEVVRKYIEEFNIRYFIINDDKLACELRNIYKDRIFLILSVTRQLTYDDIINTDFSMYNEIVLFFWFNRHLDYIKKLPKKYKYCIMVNNFCCIECKLANYHWFINQEYRCERKELGLILPEDIIYFDKYINTFKLLDRIESSDLIFDSVKRYIGAYINMDNPNIVRAKENYYNIEPIENNEDCKEAKE